MNEFSVFVLSRFFLRVDGVLFRVFDTRLYHEFGSNEVIRERKGRQAAYAHVKSVSPCRSASSIRASAPADFETDFRITASPQ